MRSPSRRTRLAVMAAAVATLAAACGQSPTPVPAAQTAPAPTASAAQGLQSVQLTVPAAFATGPFTTPRTVQIPAGWSMSVWAGVPGARLEAWTPDGAMLVSVPGDGKVLRLVPGTAGAPPTSTVLIDGLVQPHGLAFAGNTLYVAESTRLRSYDYSNGTASNPKTLADGFPDGNSPGFNGAYSHPLKSVAIGTDGSVYFNVGSSGNISGDADRAASPELATIMRIPPGGTKAEVYVRGVRNGTGLAVAPDGSVWTAVNNRDDIQYPFDQPYGDASGSQRGKVIPDYVADHPAEELAKLTQGRDLGWPYCNPNPDVQPGVAGTAYDYTAPPFIADVETNDGSTKLDCSTLTPIEQTFGAHSAPLGLSFTTKLPAPYDSGALVGIHGSWDRMPPRAPEVSWFPTSGSSLGTQQTLVGGFQNPDGSRWGRPVAAVVGPDGAVYVSDDSAGAIYRLVPPGR